MPSQLDFAPYIQAEELAALALKMANTFSPMGHEQPLADVVHAWLTENKLNSHQQTILPDRANVVAVLKGRGHGKSLLFNSHLDSEISGPEWDWGMVQPDINRTGAWREGNRLYGHTVLNDRGLMATTMIALKALRDSGVPIAGDVIFTGVAGETGASPVDEYQGLNYEGKGFGSRHLISHGVRADYALVAETTDFGISWLACGACYFKVSVPGVNQYTPRSVRPQDVREHPNSIVKMANVIQAIENWAREYETKNSFHAPCGRVVPKVNIGAVRGGVPYRPNRTSPHCAIYVDVRIVPGYDPLLVERELQQVLDETGVGARIETFLARSGAVGQNVEPLAEEVKRSFKAVTGEDPLPEAPQEVVSMWRDNNIFNQAGIPSLTFGPPRRKDPETGRLCFELGDLTNMANVYAQVAHAICSQSKG
ncbi:MAG TPA: M20/M25/M40 family metallo-hydrolase [Bryobacteraceae bacterium]|nr:M20/M25/M40 family metallo-hydrolase [Bryobacteraceae bacterium]